MTFILYQGRGLDPTNTWGGHNTKPQLYHLNIHLEPCSRFILLLQRFACHLPSRLRPFRLRDLGFDLSLPPNIILLTPFELELAYWMADSAQLYLLSWLGL
jgi:hypothetical protein